MPSESTIVNLTIVNIAYQLPALFYAVANDGKAYHCSMDTSTGNCSSVEITPANVDAFSKNYPD